MCLCALPGKAIPEMTHRYTVSGGTLNATHSFNHTPGKLR